MALTYKLGGVEFTDCPIPLAFGGRYFVVEPGAENPLISVYLEIEGAPASEIQRNKPVENPRSEVTGTGGFLVVIDRQTNRLLYKTRPGSETSIVFASPKGEEMPARLSDRRFRVGERVYAGVGTSIVHEGGGLGVGVELRDDGSAVLGGPPPAWLRDLLLEPTTNAADPLRGLVADALRRELGHQNVLRALVDIALAETLATEAPTTDGTMAAHNISLGIRRTREKGAL